MIFLVLLNLSGSEDTYPELISYLKGFNAWARPIANVWLVESYLYSSTLRDNISLKINSSDKVIVMEVGKNWASWNVAEIINDWLKQKI